MDGAHYQAGDITPDRRGRGLARPRIPPASRFTPRWLLILPDRSGMDVACYNQGLCSTQNLQRSAKGSAKNMATSAKAKKKTVRIASGLKRVRQDVKLNAANTALRSKFRTVIKNVQKAVLTGDKAKAAELYGSAQRVIDSVADKGLFHKNKAARHKSRLSAKIKALDAAPAAA